MMNRYNFSIIVEEDKDGFFAYCPDLQGCYTQGVTYEEVLTNIKDAIRLHLEDILAVGQEIVRPRSISLSSVEVAV